MLCLFLALVLPAAAEQVRLSDGQTLDGTPTSEGVALADGQRIALRAMPGKTCDRELRGSIDLSFSDGQQVRARPELVNDQRLVAAIRCGSITAPITAVGAPTPDALERAIKARRLRRDLTGAGVAVGLTAGIITVATVGMKVDEALFRGGRQATP